MLKVQTERGERPQKRYQASQHSAGDVDEIELRWPQTKAFVKAMAFMSSFYGW